MSDVKMDLLTQPFPANQIKQRQIGGGRMADYVPGEVVIKRLNEATGNNWDLQIKSVDERQMGTGTLVMAMVALTLPGLGTREHIGVQMVQDRGGEDLIKGAVTDAIKKAATLFGVGLHLYEDDAPQSQQTNRQPQQRQQQPRQQAQPQRNPNKPEARSAPAADGVPPMDWTTFWAAVKPLGIGTKQTLEETIGRTADGLSPAELHGLVMSVTQGKATARR